jgi:hypothetical protein
MAKRSRKAKRSNPKVEAPAKEVQPQPQKTGPSYSVFLLLFALPTFLVVFVLLGTFVPNKQAIIGVDSVGYYTWIHSIIFDFDLDFENEYRGLNPFGPIVGDVLQNPDGPRTTTDHLPNAFAIGPGLLWGPFVILGHVAAWAQGEAMDGFTQPYFTAVMMANVVYAWLGVILTYFALRVWFTPSLSAFAAFTAWACSPAIYYTHGQFAYSHTCSFFAVALLLCAWARLREKESWQAWAIIGACVGLATLVRWQNATYAIIIAIDLLGRGPAKHWPKMAISAIASVVLFLPQMIGWYILYGSPLTIPQGGGFMNWTEPHIINTLFASGHGLITWTPLCALAIVGLFLLPKDNRLVFAAMLTAFLLQLYVVSVAGEVGWSFGMRRMVSTTPLLAIGFALLLTRIPIKLRYAAPVVTLFILWNTLFIMQYTGYINHYYMLRSIVAFAAEHDTTPEALLQTRRLPNGDPFRIEHLPQSSRFPRGTALTYDQLISDKKLVLQSFLDRTGIMPLPKPN